LFLTLNFCPKTASHFSEIALDQKLMIQPALNTKFRTGLPMSQEGQLLDRKSRRSAACKDNAHFLGSRSMLEPNQKIETGKTI